MAPIRAVLSILDAPYESEFSGSRRSSSRLRKGREPRPPSLDPYRSVVPWQIPDRRAWPTPQVLIKLLSGEPGGHRKSNHRIRQESSWAVRQHNLNRGTTL